MVYVITGIVLYCGWFVLMLVSQPFRELSNEIWGHYFLSTLHRGWPYALIGGSVYVIVNGSLANVVRAAFGH